MENADRTERECPWCAEKILAKARLCRYCQREVDPISAANTEQLSSAQDANREAPGGVRATGDSSFVEPRFSSDSLISASILPAGESRLNHSASDAETRAHYSGLSGWPALFALSQAIAVPVCLWVAYQFLLPASHLNETALAGNTRLLSALYVEAGLAILVAVGCAMALGVILRRHPKTPTFCTSYLLLLIWISLLAIGATAVIKDALTAQGYTPASQPPGIGIQQLVFAIAWLAYWTRAKEVRETFGYNGLTPPDGRIAEAFRELTRPSILVFPIAVGACAAIICGAALTARLSQQHSIDEGLDSVALTSPESASRTRSGAERLADAYSRYLPILDSVLPAASQTGRLSEILGKDRAASRGWHELDDSTLTRYAAALGSIYASMPERDCAGLARDAASNGSSAESSTIFNNALAGADSVVQDAFAEGFVKSIHADWSHRARRYDTPSMVRASLRKLQKALGSADSVRLEGALRNGIGTASARDACWTLLAFYERMPRKVPPVDAARILRFLRPYPL